jgi:hypothetical protein
MKPPKPTPEEMERIKAALLKDSPLLKLIKKKKEKRKKEK